jgi:hypothetical protein
MELREQIAEIVKNVARNPCTTRIDKGIDNILSLMPQVDELLSVIEEAAKHWDAPSCYIERRDLWEAIKAAAERCK